MSFAPSGDTVGHTINTVVNPSGVRCGHSQLTAQGGEEGLQSQMTMVMTMISMKLMMFVDDHNDDYDDVW